MKLAKSLLLGAAAGLAAVSGASAADLGVKKPTPVEYVRVCPAYGAGYFYIPGTETCIAIGGRVRAEYRYLEPFNRNGNVNSGFRSTIRLNVDTRTQTEIGVLRAFFRIQANRGTGSMRSGTQERAGLAFGSTADNNVVGLGNKAQTFFNVDKAFIQFSGLGGVITVGRVQSFFDFYAHDLEFFGATSGSDLGSTQALAYTATFGGGFSATIAIEDPVERRSGILSRSQLGVAALGGNGIPGVGFAGQSLFGVNSIGYGDSRVPDVVGQLKYDAAFGSLQLSAAMHQINTTQFATGSNVIGAGTLNPGNGLVGFNGFPPGLAPSSKYGFAVQAGAKINLPMLAAGDVLWLQAGYSEGNNSYTGVGNGVQFGGFTNNGGFGGIGSGNLQLADAVVDLNGRVRLQRTFSATAAFLHYWTPQLRQGVFGSYAASEFGSKGSIGFIGANAGLGIVANTLPILPRNQTYTVGSNLIYSPVKGLDVGVEVDLSMPSAPAASALALSVFAPAASAAPLTTPAVGTLALPGVTEEARNVRSDRRWR